MACNLLGQAPGEAVTGFREDPVCNLIDDFLTQMPRMSRILLDTSDNVAGNSFT
jgi:hypothetical protein